MTKKGGKCKEDERKRMKKDVNMRGESSNPAQRGHLGTMVLYENAYLSLGRLQVFRCVAIGRG